MWCVTIINVIKIGGCVVLCLGIGVCMLMHVVKSSSEIYVTTIFQHKTNSHIYNLIKQYGIRVDTRLSGCRVPYIRR